ncbi:MAG: peptidylprolyl isomerase [Polyangiaceae bacterium]
MEARAVEDELLYREALRLRIDEGDLIVRQRLVQKLLVLAEDIDGASEPLRDSDLQRCFAENEGAWRLPATVELLHVVTSSRARAEALREQVEAFSRGAHDEKEAPPLGESFPTNRHVTSTIDEIERSFGADFASALPGLPLQTWSEPIESKVGWHLVRVIALAPERQARWEDVRSRLAIECQVRRREEAVRRYVARLLQEYEVYVGGERRKDLSPTNRTAPRGERSREDQ